MSSAAPKVPKLHPEIRIQLALEISAYMTEQVANLRGIELAASDTNIEKRGPKDWFPVYGIRYSREAQELFNKFYVVGLQIASGVFGSDRGRNQKQPMNVDWGTKLPKAPELPNEIRVELATEIASAMTELEAAERGIPLEGQSGGGPKDWGRRKTASISYTEQAQGLFNRFYGLAHCIVDGIFGSERR